MKQPRNSTTGNPVINDQEKKVLEKKCSGKKGTLPKPRYLLYMYQHLSSKHNRILPVIKAQEK